LAAMVDLRHWSVVASLAALIACQRPSERASEPEPLEVASEQAQVIVTGRVVRDGAPLPGVRVSYGGGDRDSALSDEAGEFRLVVVDEFARAPALHVYLKTADEHGFFIALRNHGGPIAASFDLTEPLRVELHDGSAEDQAWIDVQAWMEHETSEWWHIAPDDHAAQLAAWARIAEAIAAEPDSYRRSLMSIAQFQIGQSKPEVGLERAATAQAVLDEIGLDDPRWAINQWLLPAVAYESGRWAELGPRLDELIGSHPQPEVAAFVALARYMEYTRNDATADAEAVWQRWLDRPALARTAIGMVMASMGPKRPLAPGQPLPEVCVEELDGGSLCLADLRGRMVVLEIWTTWCKNCREVAEQLRSAQAALPGDDAPVFVSINYYDSPEAIAEYMRDVSMPWRHGWVAEAEREAFVQTLGVQSVPVLALIDVDGMILASSPELRAGALLEQIEARRRAP
jgi:thiol-disulfide isomerase/thioredoxin